MGRHDYRMYTNINGHVLSECVIAKLRKKTSEHTGTYKHRVYREALTTTRSYSIAYRDNV